MGAGEGPGRTAREDLGSTERSLVLVEERDHESVVGLRDADQVAVRHIGAEVDTAGHGGSSHSRLADATLGSLDAGGVALTKGHALAHLVSSSDGVSL